VLNIFLGNNSTILFFKIFGGFVFYGTAYYFLFRLNRNKVERLFIIYLRIAYVVALIGIFQEISYLVGFKLGHDYSLFLPNIRCQGTTLGLLQVTSILQEPSHLGSVMAPAVFVALFNIIGRKNYLMDKKASWLILICTLLSFSLVAYLGIIIIFILLMLNYKKVKTIVLASIAVAFLAVCAYVALSNIRLRVNDTAAILCGKKTIDQVNLSTLAFYGNGFVAYKSVMNNPVFGAGLGSHPVSYDRYIPEFPLFYGKNLSLYGFSLLLWVESLETLQELSLSCCKNCKQLPKLSNLRKFQLTMMSDIEDISSESLPNCVNLTVTGCRRFRRINRLPRLRIVEIKNCPKFAEFLDYWTDRTDMKSRLMPENQRKKMNFEAIENCNQIPLRTIRLGSLDNFHNMASLRNFAVVTLDSCRNIKSFDGFDQSDLPRSSRKVIIRDFYFEKCDVSGLGNIGTLELHNVHNLKNNSGIHHVDLLLRC
jgi:hypothetical protein